MTTSSEDIDPFEAMLAELKPKVELRTAALFDAREGAPTKALRLSIAESSFHVVGDRSVEVGGGPIKVAILKAAPVSRMYYSEEYGSGQSSSPTCWSKDAGGGVPAEEVTPSGMQAPACFDCTQNIKGSGNGLSRACRFQQRIAVMLTDEEGVLQPDQVCQLSLPATSVFGKDTKKKGLQTYARLIDSQGALLSTILTELSFDEGSNSPKLCFRPIRVLSEDEIAVVKAAQNDPDTKKLVTFNFNSHAASSPSTDNIFSAVKGDGVYVKSLQ